MVVPTPAHVDPLHCVACGGKGEVIETRAWSRYVRRRRACVECGARWTTHETMAPPPKPTKRWLREQALVQDVVDRVLAAIHGGPADAQ